MDIHEYPPKNGLEMRFFFSKASLIVTLSNIIQTIKKESKHNSLLFLLIRIQDKTRVYCMFIVQNVPGKGL